MTVLQLQLDGGFTAFPTFPAVDVDRDGGAIPLGAASAVCPDCCETVYPESAVSDAEVWILYPCCNSECGARWCGAIVENHDYCAECERCESCCSCTYCAHCADRVEDYCETCECCPECCGCSAGGCDCDVPRHLTRFTFPAAAGTASVDCRETVTVDLDAGNVSERGVNEIRYYLLDAGINVSGDVLASVGTALRDKRGTYAKRLTRAIYRAMAVKLSADVVTTIGNLASSYTAESGTYDVEVSRDLNESAAYWYHADSCWWTDYSYQSRCSLKANGGIGLRTLSEYGNVSGRAWVQPVMAPLDRDGLASHYSYQSTDSAWTTTADAHNADGFIVYNAYGDCANGAAARIVGAMAGMPYRRVTLYLSGQYVNGERGYLVSAVDCDEVSLDVEVCH